MKYITKFLFFGVISFVCFLVLNYFLSAFFLDYKDINLEIDLSSSTSDSVKVSFNYLPNQYGAQVTTEPLMDNKFLRVPFSTDHEIKTIYLVPTTESDLSLSKIKIKNYIVDVELSFATFDSSLYLTVEGKDQLDYLDVFNSNTYDVSGDEILAIDGKIFKEMYGQMWQPIITSALLISFLLWISLFLISMRSRHPLLNPRSDYFLSTIFLAVVFSFFFLRKEASNVENRILAPKPSFDINLWKIPSKYVKYYNDHFPFRIQLSVINNYLKIKYFQTSPNPNFVQIGKDGWLFYSTKKIRKVYQGNVLYTDSELETIKEKIELKQSYLKNKGIEFYLIIPPLKHSVYPEYLPTSLKPAQEFSKRDQVMEYLKNNTSIKIVDPFQRLLELKKERRIYYKTDTHWNQVGGFETYKMLINRIRKDFPRIPEAYSLEDYTTNEQVDYEGDLIDLLNLKGHFNRQAIFLTPKFEVQAEAIESGSLIGGEVKVDKYIIQQRADLPKLLMYRDSFTGYLFLPLSNHFSESTFIWDRNFNPERIDKEQPDIIVLEMMERFVDHLLTENEL